MSQALAVTFFLSKQQIFVPCPLIFNIREHHSHLKWGALWDASTLKQTVLGHVQPLRGDESFSPLAQTDCFTQIIDGNLLTVVDNVANKFEQFPWWRFRITYVLNISCVKVEGSTRRKPLLECVSVCEQERKELNESISHVSEKAFSFKRTRVSTKARLPHLNLTSYHTCNK